MWKRKYWNGIYYFRNDKEAGWWWRGCWDDCRKGFNFSSFISFIPFPPHRMSVSNGFLWVFLWLLLIRVRSYAKVSLLMRIDTGFRNSAPFGNIALPSPSVEGPIEGFILRDWKSCHFPRMRYQFSMDPKYSMTQRRVAKGNLKQKRPVLLELPDGGWLLLFK